MTRRRQVPNQFNWRRQWRQKVEPYLLEHPVQTALDFGMFWLDHNWKRGDAPYLLGSCISSRVVPGKLSWYRPTNRCHWIATFAMAIGIINHPNLQWGILSGDLHSVAIGCDRNGTARVVMDILLFDTLSAGQSIAFAMKESEKAPEAKGWDKFYCLFVDSVAPGIRAFVRKESSQQYSGKAKSQAERWGKKCLFVAEPPPWDCEAGAGPT